MSRTFRKTDRTIGKYRYITNIDPKYKTADNYNMQDGKMSTTKKVYVKTHSSSRGRMLFQNEMNNIMNCPDYEEYTYPDYRRKLRKVWSEYF